MHVIKKALEKYQQIKEGYNGGVFAGMSLILVVLIITIALLIHVWATVLVLKCGKLMKWSSTVKVLLILFIWLGGLLGELGMTLSGLATIGMIIYGVLHCPKAGRKSMSRRY